ncbi:SIS domain-containing protein [Flavitalea sp.]|nr:SIS domain-containing protein [Flavitalea sp.]
MKQSEYLHSIPYESGIPGSMHTALEIAGQPKLWQQVYELVVEKKESLENFLLPVFGEKDLRIILTGAGSSAFIGECVQGIFQAETQKLTQAIATTDLITHPDLYFMKDVPTLMISFARSGNSPESLEAINLANDYCTTIFHLIVTCNENGRVIKNAKDKNYYCFILPENANDKGLAMTGSFTSMLLSVMLIAKLGKWKGMQSLLSDAIENAGIIMGEFLPLIKKVAEKKYDRVIFLGSGPLLGIARECHLKLQELTDGKVICKHDSFLGFRHGPRVVINEKSLIVYLFSNIDHVFQYEKDLAESIAADSVYLPAISIGRKIGDLQNTVLDIEFNNLTNYFYILPVALIGQLLGFYQSLKLGLNPDNPSVSGAINRVVQGVTIYSK